MLIPKRKTLLLYSGAYCFILVRYKIIALPIVSGKRET